MNKGAAQEILVQEMNKSIEFMRSGGQLIRTYTVYRPSKPPVPTTIPAIPTESMQNIRTLIRFISDVLTGDAVSMVIPVMISPPGSQKIEAVVAAINWRSGEDEKSGEIVARAFNVVREGNGNIREIRPINPPDLKEFLAPMMDGILSPVPPDISSQLYARHRLMSTGFTADMLEDDPLLQDLPPPTVH